MLLVALRRKHGGALRADFQRFYGLNVDGLGRSFSVLHAADLAAHLPPDSAVAREMNPEYAWGVTEHLLATAVDTLRLLVWMQSKDGAKNRNRPKPLPRPGVKQGKQRVEKKDLLVLPVDEVKRRLALPRRAAATVQG